MVRSTGPVVAIEDAKLLKAVARVLLSNLDGAVAALKELPGVTDADIIVEISGPGTAMLRLYAHHRDRATPRCHLYTLRITETTL
jgi:hypothetical protein